MFGSTIEMLLRSQTALGHKIVAKFLSDGSAHSFQKQYELNNLQQIKDLPCDIIVTTNVYPFPDSDLSEIISCYEQHRDGFDLDKKILIYAPDQRWAEIAMLFQYHKVAARPEPGLRIFAGERNSDDIKKWNPAYSHFSQMSRWEYREWMSIFYPGFIDAWLTAPSVVHDDFLVISNQSIIEKPKETFEQIVSFCDLEIVAPLDNFAREFRNLQQYVLDEHEVIYKILTNMLSDEEYHWKPMSIIGEAILQHHCRRAGYEWLCDGLDNLPTNSVEFKQLIYKQDATTHA